MYKLCLCSLYITHVQYILLYDTLQVVQSKQIEGRESNSNSNDIQLQLNGKQC